jgi:transcriptional antiterminator RfaH
MEQWYCLFTKPHAEKQVAAALKNQGLQTYLPLTNVRGAVRKQEESPIFPCYLFLQVDFQVISLSTIQWTPGLRRVVGYGGQPTPLSAEFIELLRQKLNHLTARRQWRWDFKPGDNVRIKDGPLEDMVAVFDQPLNADQRVQVLLHILGQIRRISVDADKVEKVSTQVEESRPTRLRRTRGHGRRIAH